MFPCREDNCCVSILPDIYSRPFLDTTNAEEMRTTVERALDKKFNTLGVLSRQIVQLSVERLTSFSFINNIYKRYAILFPLTSILLISTPLPTIHI